MTLSFTTNNRYFVCVSVSVGMCLTSWNSALRWGPNRCLWELLHTPTSHLLETLANGSRPATASLLYRHTSKGGHTFTQRGDYKKCTVPLRTIHSTSFKQKLPLRNCFYWLIWMGNVLICLLQQKWSRSAKGVVLLKTQYSQEQNPN